ncbi:hypothetical protein [Mycoplasmopsis felifaucium]|uniref:hypothetical protein n=1 Tax=Mycoplasmopsis felifaucium TaxID=35768 RepID=UPI0004815979|nr:hypothetical protein [Mycoplasmopsis felifaucium]
MKTIIIDFEAVSNPFYKKLGIKNFPESYERTGLFLCYSLAFKKDCSSKWQYHFYIPTGKKLNNYLNLKDYLLEDLFLFIKSKINIQNWDDVAKQIQFFGWNPGLENAFFQSFKQTKKKIIVNNIYDYTESISLDKLFEGSKFKKSFFKTKLNHVKQNYPYKLAELEDKCGFIAAEYGYFLLIKQKEKLWKRPFKNVRDKYKTFDLLSIKTIVEELSQYSKFDSFKESFIYDHINQFNLFLKDLKNIKNKYITLRNNFIQFNNFDCWKTINKTILKLSPLIPGLNNGEYSMSDINSLIINFFENKKPDINTSFIKTFINKNPIKLLNLENITLQNFINQFNSLNSKLAGIQNSKITEIKEFIRDFYNNYIVCEHNY